MNPPPIKGVAPLRETEAPTPAQFRDEILPDGLPVVMRNVARDWPLVGASREGPGRAMAVLSANANDHMAEVIRADPSEGGRFHYRGDTGALNFVRGRGTLAAILAGLREQLDSPSPYAMAAQGLVADQFVPGFSNAHPMPLVPQSAKPRLWIGNAAKVATHNDPTENVAVVAVGHRRFTLFPPSAGANLYMGPQHPTPAGTPVSMVHVTRPDFDRYPLFSSALESAAQADLSPGDAIFIPRDWFHHVEALDPFNVLVNYWWDSAAA